LPTQSRKGIGFDLELATVSTKREDRQKGAQFSVYSSLFGI